MESFVGRARELAELNEHLEHVRRTGRGRAVMLRGRRRIGKSRLATELVRRSSCPHVYHQAAFGVPFRDELASLAGAIAASNLPGAGLLSGVRPDSLTAALSLLAATLPTDAPSVVVLDELPWLLAGTPGGAGELQRVWDTELSSRPVLLLLLGSDLAMMERLNGYDQPFHGRGAEMVLHAMNPRDIAAMTGLSGMDAFDAALITGGQPLVAEEWRPGESPHAFVTRSFQRETSALVVAGARMLDSEFPPTSHARAVLTAVGGRGARAHTAIRDATGLPGTSLERSLRELRHKRVLAVDAPLSLEPATKANRWRIADPALRFYLAMVAPVLPEIERGRPDVALARFEKGYPSWRGRAVEPIVRDALERALPNDDWPDVAAVGGWWPRSNTPEVDLIGADRSPATRLGFVGTIKWRESPLDRRDVDTLARDAIAVPGYTAGVPLVGVCPAGGSDARLSHVWDADDLLAAWP